MYNTTLNSVPLTCLQGTTVDISALLRFYFWQPVYFKLSEPSFPSEYKEALGHVVGISELCGHALTYKILSSESDIIIYHSLLCPAIPDDGNVHACMSGGETSICNEYDTFIDKGHHTKVKVPDGYKKIWDHLNFDVKHDVGHKVRLVADGHLIDIPLESVYSGVVSLRGFRIVLFLAELKHLEIWSTDIGNAYLEAYTSEKVYIVAGPELGENEGHILIISKALYILRVVLDGMIDLLTVFGK
jgi:Reverse transcriptase (RNA-dependent DNA polymerase)